jgi:hypothetical protein
MEVNTDINLNKTIVRMWNGFICLRTWTAANFCEQGSIEGDQFLDLLTSAFEELRSMGFVSLYCLP